MKRPERQHVSGTRANPWAELSKHAFILLVLTSAFFPLYMMLNISTKDNRMFFRNPWTPEVHAEGAGTWWNLIAENYRLGWKTIGNSIPNTIFLAVATTAGTLMVAVLAAYVFARFRFPGKRLLRAALMVLLLMPSVANLIPLIVLFLFTMRFFIRGSAAADRSSLEEGRAPTVAPPMPSSLHPRNAVRGRGGSYAE